jgi:aminoglycoside phosphotransferase (APT) family kinase protein
MPVTDQELRQALGAEPLHRRPWPYRASLPMEELDIRGQRLLLKDLSGSDDLPRPPLAPDPRREIAVYRDVLAPLGVSGTPEVAAADETSSRWLVLELVDGTPLWQIGDLAVWQEAARWLARLHALPVPADEALVRYDAAHLRERLELTAATERFAERVADRLAALPVRLIHGDFFPANILVEAGPRIRVVDWETCGTGPAVLDVAALISGRWSEQEREQILDAYLAASPALLRLGVDDLLYARLLHAAQWIGWHDGWSPPPEQRHDWRAEFVELSERLGL